MEECTRKSLSEIGHNGIIYQFPDGSYDIIVRSDGFFKAVGWEDSHRDNVEKSGQKRKRAKGVKSSGADMKRSMQRARANVRRLALANEFKYFVTLTLDPAKVDRYDAAAVTKVLNRWADNMVRRHGLKYILVPERHKDGAFHFHGFFNDTVRVVDSGHRDPRGEPIWNMPEWGYGFTTAMELYGEYSAAVSYVCKYIGKQDAERPLGRWYYSGGAIKPPDKTYVDLDYRALQAEGNGVEFGIPGSKILIIRGKDEENGAD